MDRIGPYELGKELGRGAMGVVFRARHVHEDREVALKIIQRQALAKRGDGDALFERYRRGARAAQQLGDHPAIVTVSGVGEFDDRLYIAMALVHGRALDVVLHEDTPTPEEIARWGFEVARALAHAHSLGTQHRDVNPGNILIEVSGRALLTDFGLPPVAPPDAEAGRLTPHGELLGTPAYMAPEQIAGDALDGRTDVYALGATLYEALAGRPPFTGDSNYALLMAAATKLPVRLRHVAPATPEPLERIVARCLAKDPADRYATADVLAEELERFLNGDKVMCPPNVTRRFARSGARSRATKLLALLVVAGAAAAGAAWWLLTQR